ncbi:CIC11C00000005389 [Sungouiella intermedia]|uniref:CIC11C00000005389 n=1 Tax=Sungouiella intermedia TaxID=45354 RepID=A0A1L0GKW2_9ASCO|nr:CIC11C00000005389 [[Candida] intermedia]
MNSVGKGSHIHKYGTLRSFNKLNITLLSLVKSLLTKLHNTNSLPNDVNNFEKTSTLSFSTLSLSALE